MDIKQVGVVGCGIMGSGITEVCARSGYQVSVAEIDEPTLKERLTVVRASLDKAVGKGKLKPAARDAALGRIAGVASAAEMGGCDLVIEAVNEELELKQRVFAALDAACHAHAILASNTSCLPIMEMARATGRPARVLGLHFMNPVPVMDLLELVTTGATGSDVVAAGQSFAASLGKTVVMTRDAPGFIVNRLMIPPIVAAIEMLEAGSATAADIDTSLRLGLNHPMGPLALADLVGLDTVLYIADGIYNGLGDVKYAAPPTLRKMVAEGNLGRKTGRGFYEYGNGRPRPTGGEAPA